MASETILVANRGEIACRIMRTIRALGLRSVAVHSEADADAPHVALADEAICIGPAPVTQSYLNISAILDAAQASGAQAIHPGYGFLSENAGFARAVSEAGLTFIGPSPRAIETMGDKAAAKRAMIEAGVPCLPGYQGKDQSDATLLAEAERIGLPLMVKAAAGGGGRGMRLVAHAAELPDALARARAEAQSTFGDDALILERAVQDARHVEIQVFADSHGTALHLGERDCSVQRRHQKVIEEAPCPVLTPELRAAMGRAAVQAARTVDYLGAGTVEFLLDADGSYYFLEMNTRLQVEHPVTEMITGLDLVALQIAVAKGAPLRLAQEDINLDGHAIEVRIYAEDPAKDFLPATGRIAAFDPAMGEGIRVDAGIATNQAVSPHYDPLLAKVIAHGPTREVARQRLLSALEQTVLLGVTTNAAHLADILAQPAFVAGRATTGFIAGTYGTGIPADHADSAEQAAAAALIVEARAQQARTESTLPDDSLMGFASDGGQAVPLDLELGGSGHTVFALAQGPGCWQISGPGWRHEVKLLATPPRARMQIDGRRRKFSFALDDDGGLYLQSGSRAFHIRHRRSWAEASEAGAAGSVTAPMPGLVISVDVQQGQPVEKGQVLAVLEAMKMQHQLRAGTSGIVSQVDVRTGQQVEAGTLIAIIEETETTA
ncbi:acetyl-CoA carboxylase biotin carboxylase subunit [Lutimaribacter sp. EGI FJ00015]|uniref:Acetyl-CoA carboxylase biotin carboxylase subunit n=1 Tax=Lutimaribacter degradans TaxID=2945989 RepID=A0ACC5ZYX9_9RHOB|nr:acetyl-CoA carboxylase biotin carboxylase subunit [Lutimaribacter sp. EGI FJ00013]MCM2563554.1 acetyl-CoA carboxylase biotin carboxylase subunit [Lutimaribacter sp. EGI FJ00013]MCO0614783.1 acetyl-CoA carboxylase biotin carboxylase subunit [Lutimaribacter sp. EGI FJ00015]MCO0637452.1 acetyl-CoA carboxylase biotin carboxylase subunit [Lutimaribacter sp. EGI FJ00014]